MQCIFLELKADLQDFELSSFLEKDAMHELEVVELVVELLLSTLNLFEVDPCDVPRFSTSKVASVGGYTRTELKRTLHNASQTCFECNQSQPDALSNKNDYEFVILGHFVVRILSCMPLY